MVGAQMDAGATGLHVHVVARLNNKWTAQDARNWTCYICK